MFLPDLRAPFGRALAALSILAVDPGGLGGIAVRARSGPVRDALLAQCGILPQPVLRLHPSASDDDLTGAIDISATLAEGRIVQEQGLLDRAGTLLLGMAERCPPRLAARLALALDSGRLRCLVACDEGAAEDEGLPRALAERLAFAVDLDGLSLRDVQGGAPDAAAVRAARDRLAGIALPDGSHAQVAAALDAFGVDSGRAGPQVLRAARVLAALSGRDRVETGDLEAACILILPQRATRIPEEAPPPDPDTPPPPEPEVPPPEEDSLVLPEELLIEAVRAMLPDDLLDGLAARAARGQAGAGAGAGAARKGNRRGRPLPSRPGRPGGGLRVDLVATLRAAAPWQRLRPPLPDPARLRIRPGDLRLRRYEERSDRLIVFAVDASGSAALARLAEAKGAVELLLARAYARRDHVALLAFRGSGAEILLAPTRSLVQTKRRLAALPGGGATPLAAGLIAGLALAEQGRRRGLDPQVVLLTDGRANVARDGTRDRIRAAEDARDAARILRAKGLGGVVIDTGNRAEPALADLARTLGAAYVPLPRADARRLSAAVSAALGD